MTAPSRSSIIARVSDRLGALSANQRGSIAIITAVALPVVFGFGGLAVDASIWLRAKNAVQGAADPAASSAAAAAVRGNTPARRVAEANGVSAGNGYQNGVNGVTVTLNHPPTLGAYVGDPYSFEAIVTAPQQFYLTRVLKAFHPTLAAPTVPGRAVARTPPQSTCILSLGDVPVANNGNLVVQGGAPLNAANCDVDADSPANNSLNTSGGGSINAANIRSVGGILGGNMTVTGAIIPNGPYIADPYAYERTIPSIPAFQPKSANNWSGNISNPTGVLAFNASPASQGGGGDVTINKSVTLAPGIYIISGGSLRMTANNPNVSLNGTGVTIILTSPTPSTDNGVFNFSGGTLNLTAPTTGSTAGIALWADSRLPYVTDSFSSNVVVNINGAIYLPSHNVQYQGNNLSQNTGCKQLIAWTIVITGTSNFNHNCPPGSGTLDPAITWSLVE